MSRATKHLTSDRATLAGLLMALGGGVALTLFGCTGADFHSGSSSDAKAHDTDHPAHDHGDGGEIDRVMGSVEVGAGDHAGDVATVNGAVDVGEKAVVGEAHVVNGAITIGAHATATGAVAVNGGIQLSEGAGISGAVQTVNGPITLADSADVKGDVTNVNGAIKVAAAHVGGDIHTVNGDIEVGPNGHVDGGIHVERNNSWFHSDDKPRVVILSGSVVKGTLRFDRPVDLFVSDRASIGPVQGATARTFSGAEPPSS
jgi:cytoskeletal protein CcmA (bactofilin family)